MTIKILCFPVKSPILLSFTVVYVCRHKQMWYVGSLTEIPYKHCRQPHTMTGESNWEQLLRMFSVISPPQAFRLVIDTIDWVRCNRRENKNKTRVHSLTQNYEGTQGFMCFLVMQRQIILLGWKIWIVVMSNLHVHLIFISLMLSSVCLFSYILYSINSIPYIFTLIYFTYCYSLYLFTYVSIYMYVTYS